jgi:hypothetical protein
VTLYLVTGPPAAGKSTWVRQHAKQGDITIDYDALANVLTPAHEGHDHTDMVKAVTKAARQAAIDTALQLRHRDNVNVYVIHSMPSTALVEHYRAHGAQVVTVDPGRAIVLARCKAERPWRMTQAAKEWYATRRDDPAPMPTPTTGAMPW